MTPRNHNENSHPEYRQEIQAGMEHAISNYSGDLSKATKETNKYIDVLINPKNRKSEEAENRVKSRIIRNVIINIVIMLSLIHI